MTGPEATAEEVERLLQARWPETRIEPSLVRMQALMQLMDDPQSRYPVVHITGTNGKSSTARMVDELFRALGLRTGRFTSPHLESSRERICLNGEPITEERYVATFAEIEPYLKMVDDGFGVPEDAQHVPVSYFETMTAMAYAAFADAPVDVAIVEVGMGGTWDATNVADGRIAVITPIGIEHAKYLGDTIAQIAGEKAGIIKPGATAILAAQEQEAAEVLLARCAEVGAVAAREGVEFGVVDRQVAVGGQMLSVQGLDARYDELLLHLWGEHQASNAACALAAVEAFFGTESTQVMSEDVVREAFFEMTSPGRLEVVRTSPTTLVDATHNPAGMRATVRTLQESFDFSRLIGVFAAASDKDIAGMLELLEPVLDEVVITRNNSSRSDDIDGTARIAVEYFGADRVVVEPDLPEAINTAVTIAEEGEHFAGVGVLVTGSVYTAGDARKLFNPDRKKPWEKS
ncbi:bifunctional folylpolyglutamate synthase/dihydrofolate synthase [Cumulibacter manganitolerans]|uniref:bifunctional folylpolyglutamate synthase/dihydrofolate synthase n=1 Tax=Cumulibacter manganitolerans TaxID=1884992 RepID=UPI001297DF16|nr:folylpolyglutamate synthase/dihydrofolate synthase family protein [Cumulibacter manganitolerans]